MRLHESFPASASSRLLLVSASLLLLSHGARAQRPELVVQTGHTFGVSSLAFAPSGGLVASASGDKTVKLWNPSNGQLLRTLTGCGGFVMSVALSPDARVVAGACYDGVVKVWGVADGRELLTLRGHAGAVMSVAFSRDARLVATGGADKTVRVWDALTGGELRALKGHRRQVTSVAFGAGALLASAASDGSVRLWDADAGRELKTLAAPQGVVKNVAFGPDGRTLAGNCSDGAVRVWDASSGGLRLTLAGAPDSAESLAYSPEGESVASGGGGGKIRLWDARRGQLLREVADGGSDVSALAFGAGGKTLAVGHGFDGAIGLFDVATARRLRTLGGSTRPFSSVAFGGDGKLLAGGSLDGTVKLWDLARGQDVRVLAGRGGEVEAVAFGPDSKLLASAAQDHQVTVWDVEAAKPLRVLRVEDPARGGGAVAGSESASAVAFSPDGRTLAGGDSSGAVDLWEVETGRLVRAFAGDGRVNSLAFGEGGRALVSGGTVWDVASGRELRRFEGVTLSALARDGRTLACVGADRAVRLYDLDGGAELREWPAGADEIVSLSFSPDGRVLAAGDYSHAVHLWDVSSGRPIRALEGHTSLVASVAFSADGRVLASSSGDGSIKLWEAATGVELAALVAPGERDWLVVAPDGLFDGSPAAWNQVLWRYDHNTFEVAPVEWFFNEFFYPGLLADIFAGKRPAAPHDFARLDRRQPKIKISAADGATPAAVGARELRLRIDVEENTEGGKAGSGAFDLRLFRNGTLVRVWRGDVLKGRRAATYEVVLPVVAGDNSLLAYAFNRDNMKSPNATLSVRGADSLRRKGTARVLAVGVNVYSNAGFNLRYAAADARDFAAEVGRQLEGLQTFDRVEVTALADADATRAKITRALAQLAAASQPEDAVVVYFAGHGTARGNRFYLLPHDLGYAGSRDALDEAGLRTILSRGISDRELEAAFEKIDGAAFLLVIDACNSGQALEAEERRRGPMNSKGLAQLAYEKGMYVLTAAQSYQAANEAAQLGHGLLTYALVEEGLKAMAADDEPKDGTLQAREWLDYATARVPQMQLDEMRRSLARGINLSFADEERQLDMSARAGQRPRVFYRRELEAQPLVIARR
jgi:WD40 repeat protein